MRSTPPAASNAPSRSSLQRERRTGLVVGPLTLIAVIVTLAAVLLSARAAHDPSVHGTLRTFAAHERAQLLAVALRVGGLLLTLPFVVVWHRVLRARDDSVSRRVMVIGVVAFVMIGAGTVLGWVALHDASQSYLAGRYRREQAAIDASMLLDVVRGLDIASRVLFAGWLAYSSLRASRVGLLTPFLGMWGLLAAVTGTFLEIGDALYIGWLVSCALLLTGYWPAGRPPSWTSGRPEPPSYHSPADGSTRDNDRSLVESQIGSVL
jgi:hypothetical protein